MNKEFLLEYTERKTVVFDVCAVDVDNEIVIHTYPMNFTDITGLPCRVIAEIF